jgi:hypothetical protein
MLRAVEIRRALDDRNKDAPLIRTASRRVVYRAPVARAAAIERVAGLIAGERRIVLVDGDNVIGRDPEANVQLTTRPSPAARASSSREEHDARGSRQQERHDGRQRADGRLSRNGDRFACGQVLLVYRESRAGFPAAISQPNGRGFLATLTTDVDA